MVKFSGVLFRSSTFIFILTSVAITKGDIIIVSAIEGEETQLDFSYPCNSSRVTLQYGIEAPFYDSANQESPPLHENQKLVVHTDITRNNCFIRMLFTPVLKYDEGLYILIAHAGEGDFIQVTSVSLRVDYPPGKASCGWGEENFAADWRSLECTALSGNLYGEIICYQNGIRIPSKGNPTESGNILEQTMWAKYSQPAFCCAVAVVVGHAVDRCECTDYKWDPNNNVTEPCPVVMVTTHHEASTFSQSPTSSPTKEVTQKTKKNHRLNVVFHMIYLCVIGISAIVIIGFSIACSMSKRKAKHVKKYGKTTFSQSNQFHVQDDGNRENIM